MSGSFSQPAGGQYSQLLQALAQRGARQQPQQPQYETPLGGTMQSAIPQFGGVQPASTPLTQGLGAMPSAGTMADMLQRMAKSQSGPGPSMWERIQGWGQDLGSRMPAAGQQGAPIQTYDVGQTPVGGGY